MKFLALNVVGTWFRRAIHSISVRCHDLDFSWLSEKSLLEVHSACSFPFEILFWGIVLSLCSLIFNGPVKWIHHYHLTLLIIKGLIFIYIIYLYLISFQKLAKLIELLFCDPIRIDRAVIYTMVLDKLGPLLLEHFDILLQISSRGVTLVI